ncbi:MAG: putative nucleic acid-binding protein contains domain [Chthonomonadales bacterium]|nr:putative nucleic acid-binding protein contains domain [Chthonomonadales bacterium]
MPEVFGDTSGLIAAFVSTETEHQKASRLMRQWNVDGTFLVTTNYILTEIVALYVSRVRTPRALQILTIERLRESNWVETVHVTAELDLLAWQLFVSRSDKNWSLVDCTSFVLMQQRGIASVLTSDHHFEQAGFQILL